MLKEMEGAVLSSISGDEGSDELFFYAKDGRSWRMYHDQDCCESVTIDDIVGDLNDLIDTPIIEAREETSTDVNPDSVPEEFWGSGDSFTWTFYVFRTMKGTVTIRWYGSSNGYYSESVSVSRVVDYDSIQSLGGRLPEGRWDRERVRNTLLKEVERLGLTPERDGAWLIAWDSLEERGEFK